jgi:hypothetical protein
LGERPNHLWLTDLTEHPTDTGKLYLCAVKDACSNRIVGYSMNDRMTSQLAVDALTNAVALRRPAAGTVVHSDRAAGVMSMLSSPLYLEDETTLGALNLYAKKPDAFDEIDMSGCAILSTHSAIALSRAADREKKDHLQKALQSNRKIGAAIGIVMSKYLLTEQQAFDALRIASQHSHRKLIDIAYEVVDTGQLTMPDRQPLLGLHN